MAGVNLPVDVDDTYPDDPTDPTVKIHQQHHGSTARVVNAFDIDLMEAAAAGQPLVYDATSGLFRPGLETGAALAILRAGLIAWDTFSDRTSLGDAESGHTWEVQQGSFTVGGGQASSSTTSMAALPVGMVAQDVSCKITPAAGAPQLAFRVGPTSANRLALALDTDNDELIIQKTDSGAAAVPLSTAAVQIDTAHAYTARVIAIEDDLVGYLHDGSEIVATVTHTLTGGDATKFGAGTSYTRVGLRNSGTATFDDLLVRIAYPVASGSGGGSLTLDDMPAGHTHTVIESGGTYIRGTARTDVYAIFIGVSDASAFMLNNDSWFRTNV